jgi:nucleotide-binding universal stress UspA family protein
MNIHFKIVGLAVSFSPTTAAMVQETIRIVHWFQSNLILIHVGSKNPEKSRAMDQLMNSTGIDLTRINVLWVEGDPADQILKVCKQEQVDLLVAGALKKENLVNHYLGTVARKIMRKAKCSIWMICDPTLNLKPLNNIVVDAEGNADMIAKLNVACYLAKKQATAWVHIVRELKLLGLALSAREQCTESEYQELQQNMEREETDQVQRALDQIHHRDINVNIKLLSGKSGYELSQFAKRKAADLLIIQAPPRKYSFFDRIFTHDLEYIFSDLPCNLLILQSPGKS